MKMMMMRMMMMIMMMMMMMMMMTVADPGFGERGSPQNIFFALQHFYIKCLINKIYNTLKAWKIYMWRSTFVIPNIDRYHVKS